MSDSDFTRGADLWQRWEAPDVLGDAAPPTAEEPEDVLGDAAPPTAEELEALHERAYHEGFAAGRRDGLKQGVGEVKARGEELRALIEALARPLEQLDAQVEEELVALAIALTRQLVRREIRTDPGVVVAAIREALGVLPLSAREVAVKLHPEDAALVREVFAETQDDPQRGWHILESPAVIRGGCVVVTSTSQVDATVERRLATAIRHVFGDERVSNASRAQAADGGGDPP